MAHSAHAATLRTVVCSTCLPRRNPWLMLAEKASFAALTIFAAFSNMKFFIPAFIVGVACGMQTEGGSRTGHHHHTGGCSQGFLARVTGIELPEVLSVGAEVAGIASHVDHHKLHFIGSATIALYAGALAGQKAAASARWTCSCITCLC